MVNCFDQAMKLGANVRWGDTGPRMLTRVLEQFGCIDRAASSAVCYPIHWSQALDVLRPLQAFALVERTRSSLFLHLWNEILRYAGVQKSYIPPRNSLLRGLFDLHQVGGWMGEYDEYSVEQLFTRYLERERRAAENA